MRTKRKMSLATAQSLYNKFELSSRLGVKQIRLDPRTELPIIDLIGHEIGCDQFELDQTGLFVSTRALQGLADRVKRIVDSAQRFNQKRNEEFQKRSALTAGLLPPTDEAQAAAPADFIDDELPSTGAPPDLNPLDWALVNPEAVRTAIAGCSTSNDRKPRKLALESLLARPIRRLPGVHKNHLVRLEQLREDFPNFGEVIDVIRDHLFLLLLGNGPISLPPVLLVGPPGVGKTYFVGQLCKALELSLEMRSMADTSAGWVITGGHQTWGGAQMGAVAKLVIEGPNNTAPLLLLDEIDKTPRGNYSAQHSMLGLLEAHTAARFRDEYLDVEMDVRPMCFMATANVALAAGSPLASRLTTINIDVPGPGQMGRIVRSVDKALRAEKPVIGGRFEPLSQELVDSISSTAPRELKAKLSRAYAAAARVANSEEKIGQIRLKTEHFEDARDNKNSSFAAKLDVAQVRRSTPVTQMVAFEAWSFRLH